LKPFTITLTGSGITLADVVQVARLSAGVTLDEGARKRVTAARAVVDRLARSDVPIYGVNTALGANTGKAIPTADLAAYQERAVQARAVGVGPRFATDTVRAMMFARAAGMAVGGSGVSTAVLDALLALLNAGVHPVVPSKGSIGAADLAPLSHLALPLLGQGQAELHGDVLAGGEALRRAGIAPIALAAKDGLALVSSNAATVGYAALVLTDCAEALDALNIAAALSLEGFRANLSVLDDRALAARPARGQHVITRRLGGLLEGSELWKRGVARRVQDPISLRCVTQVHGASIAALRLARDDVELELNSASESPLVVTEPEAIISNGNFHVAGLALAFDACGLALAQAAMLCVERCQRLYSPAMSGLPLQLTTRGPEHSGFATLQKTLTALYNEIRHLANPASLDCLPVSEAVEDHASMAMNVVAKTAAMAPSLRFLAAIELLTAAQAIDLRALAPSMLGRGACAVYEAVRTRVPMLDEDRPLGPDIEAIEALIAGGGIGAVDLLERTDAEIQR
jgi:histidine ammonia-lyase